MSRSKKGTVSAMPTGPTRKSTSIDEADNGGFIVRDNNEKPGEYRPPKQNVFSSGHEMLRHIAKRHGIGMRKAERGSRR